ncbi:MAG: DUF4142 domain-containing protein [Ginsengibacter sp.]
MKKLSLASIIAGAMIFSACNGNSSTSTSSDSTTTMTTKDTTTNAMATHDTTMAMNKDTAMVDKDAQDFDQDAAAGGMMEVQLGKIAENNSATQSVKDFGKMMVDDHSKINDQLKDLASKKNVSLPTAVTNDQQKDIDKLNKETGASFDKDYVSMMVKDHEKDIAAFKKAGSKIKDADFKDFIIKNLPTLQKHLDAIKAIKNKM